MGVHLLRSTLLGRFNLSNVAHKAGVRVMATNTDSTIAETMVTENCR